MSLSESKGIWLMAGLVAAAAAALIWIVVSAQPLRLAILYDEVGGLKHDDPVVWKGRTIGKVERIKPLSENRMEVSVLIGEDYAPRISRGAEFILRKASFFGLIGLTIRWPAPAEDGRLIIRRSQTESCPHYH